ncbi:hypothetical protein AK812_SmicGene31979 [Symbiodinium microadriaticum]|uniref:Uncharacterized protein n=1 Tax=Symbiodinium microadriaticum TaxID=2951 RepID=A0A1Q9CVA8_SYMMI|nr:hypothetical protein AK812_SmicGene31979 [Symbiodinium microadriaticum]
MASSQAPQIPRVPTHLAYGGEAASRTSPNREVEKLKPEIQELLGLLRKALHLVCEELRRTHKCNKHLEERQSDLAAELEELKPRSVQLTRLGGAVKVNNRPERIELTNHPVSQPLQASHLGAVIPARHLAAAPAAAPAAGATPAASSARSSVAASPASTSAPDGPRRPSDESKKKNRASSDRSSMASGRRVTLKLSRSILKKLSANAGLSQKEEQGSDSGSEIFEANNPEEVQEMQRILEQLSWKYEYMQEGGNEVGQEDGADLKPAREEEPETSPSVRASLSRRLTPGMLEDETGSLPPRRLTLFQALLHTDSRVGRIFRRSYFGKKNLQRHFLHAGAPDGNEERLLQLASWFFQRPRPYAQTDAAIAYGFLDPPVDSVDGLAAELITQPFRRRVLLLSPESQSGTQSLWTAVEAAGGTQSSVEHRFIPSKSPLPHEVATSAVQFAVDQWLRENTDADTETPSP